MGITAGTGHRHRPGRVFRAGKRRRAASPEPNGGAAECPVSHLGRFVELLLQPRHRHGAGAGAWPVAAARGPVCGRRDLQRGRREPREPQDAPPVPARPVPAAASAAARPRPRRQHHREVSAPPAGRAEPTGRIALRPGGGVGSRLWGSSVFLLREFSTARGERTVCETRGQPARDPPAGVLRGKMGR